MKTAATIILVFLLLQTPGREGWGAAIIITPGDREDTTTAHCVFLPKAAGGPHAGQPLFRSRPPMWRCSLKGAGAVPRLHFWTTNYTKEHEG